jgi:hypothetical protein
VRYRLAPDQLAPGRTGDKRLPKPQLIARIRVAGVTPDGAGRVGFLESPTGITGVAEAIDRGRAVNSESKAEPDQTRFATTHWSVVLTAGQSDSSQASEAMARLCRTYWYPLYVYVRRKGYQPADAQDLTQEFFTRLLARNYLGDAERRKGKFRSFLLGALEHFLAREWKRAAPRSGAAARRCSRWMK